MQFTGASSILLPQAEGFNFSLSGIKIPNSESVSLSFYDTENKYFRFLFANGYISTNKIIGTYNSQEDSFIDGYFQSGLWHYTVNGILDVTTGVFSKLNNFVVNVNGSGTASLDLSVLSLPINYSVALDQNYECFGSLTGVIITDTAFQLVAPSFTFFNSNSDLLNNPYSTGTGLSVGANSLQFSDLDGTFAEYANNLYLKLVTSFGDIGSKFSPNRTGVASKYVLSFSDLADNVYHQSSLFKGAWENDRFSYADNVLSYDLNFNFDNSNYLGDDGTSKITIDFSTITPINNGNYAAEYITGFNLVSGGLYSGTPTGIFNQYYYVTGLQNPLSTFLFSTGCGESLNVTFNGGSPISGASGKLYLKPVRLSGLYGAGVNRFKMISGYSNSDYGWAYQTIPSFSIATGGACFSLPDVSGETSQFKKASGYGSVYLQAGGLTGYAVMTGSGVSGFQITNIGFGYDSAMFPKVTFSGGAEVSGATGNFLMKHSGLYDFGSFWSAEYNLGKDFVALTPHSSGYSGAFYANGENNFSIKLLCSGLDNTSPVSGLLSIVISGNGNCLTGQKVISQSRIYDLSTGALAATFPTNSLIPLPDLSYSFGEDQFDSQYQSDTGLPVDNIISF